MIWKHKRSLAKVLMTSLTLCSVAFGLQSCGTAQKEEEACPRVPTGPASKAPIDESGLPIIKVDQEHLQIKEPGAKQMVYEIPESTAFILDVSDYKIKSLKEISEGKISGGEKIVQIVAGRDKMFDVPIIDEQRIKVAPPFRLEKGNRVVLAVGYKKVEGRTMRIFPVWVGLIDVK